ncbi:MAG: hypothetical protein HQ478_16140 [Chloroflexi bacterium]|nr:hypothetical protein [Chloroflexota bacterium]
MGTSRARALEYAYNLLTVPRVHMRVRLHQTQSGVSLLYENRLLTRVYLNRSGMTAAGAMADALGVKVPALGEYTEAVVSTGLLHRVLSLSTLDYRNPASFDLARYWLDEAESLRSSGSDS